MIPTIEDYSEGYYLSELYIEPDEDGPTLQANLHEYVDTAIYTKTDAPVTVRIRNVHFELAPSADLPIDVLGLPQACLDELGISNPPTKETVLIAKPSFAYQLQMFDTEIRWLSRD